MLHINELILNPSKICSHFLPEIKVQQNTRFEENGNRQETLY